MERGKRKENYVGNHTVNQNEHVQDCQVHMGSFRRALRRTPLSIIIKEPLESLENRDIAR